MALRRWSDFLLHRDKNIIQVYHQLPRLSANKPLKPMVCTYSYYPSSYYSGKGEPQDQLHNLWGPCAKWKCSTSCSKNVDKQLQDRNSRAWHQVQISSEPRALCNRTHPHLWSRSWCCSDVPGLFFHDGGSYPSLPHQEAASINHPRLPFTWLSLLPTPPFRESLPTSH